MSVLGVNFFTLNLFNILITSLGLFFVYEWVRSGWNKSTALLALSLGAGNIIINYFARTPMYDWPTAVMFFWVFFVLHPLLQQANTKQFIFVGTVFGARNLKSFFYYAGPFWFFVIWIHCVRGTSYKEKAVTIIRDGVLMLGVALVFNAPWLWVQIQTFPDTFLKNFLNDNLFRFFRDQPHDAAHKDYYGFFLYSLLCSLPWTPLLLAGFNKANLKSKNPFMNMASLRLFYPAYSFFHYLAILN